MCANDSRVNESSSHTHTDRGTRSRDVAGLAAYSESTCSCAVISTPTLDPVFLLPSSLSIPQQQQPFIAVAAAVVPVVVVVITVGAPFR